MTLTLLMLGTVNHPHVEHLALAMQELGHRVVVGGDIEPSLPASVLPGEGIDVHVAPPGARRTVTGLVRHVHWIRGMLREVRPDVVHAHWIPGFAFFAAVAGASPLVAMAWGSDVLRADRRQLVAGRFTVRRANLVMTDSKSLLARLEELGVPSERTFLVNWGVALDAFSPASDGRAAVRARLGLDEGPTVLSPRSLSAIYNVPTIVEAFERLTREREDVRLVVKHMGIDNRGVGPLAHSERVRLLGHVPYEQMADYYRAADVCVSIASSDSSPRSAWEAMACGTPLVVSDLPWVHELIEDGRHALVVPIDAGAVAAAIKRILSEPDLATELAANGRELVERHRDRGAEMLRLSSAYAELAGRRPGRSGAANVTIRDEPARERTVAVDASSPRVAVIVPCYGDGPLVREAVSSIQEDEPVQIVVVDDNSSDDVTLAELRRLEAEGVTVVRHATNRGVANARDTGLQHSSAPFVFPLDADDLAVPGRLAHLADRLEADEQVGVIFGDYQEFGEASILRAVPTRLDPYRLAYTNEYPISALFRRSLLEHVGGFRPAGYDGRSYEDWNLWMSLVEHGERGQHAGVGVTVYRRRLHGERKLQSGKRRHAELYRKLKAAHPQLFASLREHRHASDLSAVRKILYPVVYGGRRRFRLERRIKAALDRIGIWTLRR